MNKTLLILRHAKSSWSDEKLADHDRPLNERGKRDAPRVGQMLKQTNRRPDAIVSSTARRARKTAQRVAEHCEYQGPVQLEDALYLAEPQTVLQCLAHLPDAVQTALVVGHNPGLELLVERLTGQHVQLPTAALVEVQLDCEQWQQVVESHGRFIELWTPRDD